MRFSGGPEGRAFAGKKSPALRAAAKPSLADPAYFIEFGGDILHLSMRHQSIIIRRAEFAELVDLRHRVLRAGLPREEAIFPGDELPTNFHFGAFGEAEASPALCCATFHLNSWKDQPAWQLRGMATDPAWVGRGLGRGVLQFAITTITESSAVKLFWCNARVPAIPFYEKLGWKIASQRFEIPTAGPHHQMVFEM